MKKALLLLLCICLFGACHKKEYPIFNYSQNPSYSHTKPSETHPPSSVTTQQAATPPAVLLATEREDLASVVAAPSSQPAVSSDSRPAPELTQNTNRAALTGKLASRKIQETVRKIQSPEKAKKANARIDTVSLLSLVAGLGGLALLLLTGSGVGLLLGVLGLILGIVGLSRIRKGKAPGSSRTLAILGIVFGGLVVLLGLLVIAVFASFGLL